MTIYTYIWFCIFIYSVFVKLYIMTFRYWILRKWWFFNNFFFLMVAFYLWLALDNLSQQSPESTLWEWKRFYFLAFFLINVLTACVEVRGDDFSSPQGSLWSSSSVSVNSSLWRPGMIHFPSLLQHKDSPLEAQTAPNSVIGLFGPCCTHANQQQNWVMWIKGSSSIWKRKNIVVVTLELQFSKLPDKQFLKIQCLLVLLLEPYPSKHCMTLPWRDNQNMRVWIKGATWFLLILFE